jgi:hypothetical protein
MHLKARMAFEPGLDLWVLVRGVVVGDQVQGEAFRGGVLACLRLHSRRLAPFRKSVILQKNKNQYLIAV